jgi:hypothetical protein
MRASDLFKKNSQKLGASAILMIIHDRAISAAAYNNIGSSRVRPFGKGVIWAGDCYVSNQASLILVKIAQTNKQTRNNRETE